MSIYGYQEVNKFNPLSAGFQQAGNSPAEPLATLITQEFVRISSAVSDLDCQLDDLIKKISPICQSLPAPGVHGSLAEEKTEAPPSEVRQTLIHLRGRIESMACRISAIKYAIEV